MKKVLIYIGVLLCLFITTSTAAVWGIKQVGVAEFALLFAMFLFDIIVRSKRIIDLPLKEEYSIVTIFVIYSIVLILLGNTDPIQTLFFFIVAPIIASILLNIQDISVKRNICRVIMFFYFAECALALYERIFQVNVFPYEEATGIVVSDAADWSFRSTAFLGHPLNNALGVSIILGFILVSRFSTLTKLICLACGFMSFLCFNARGAIIIGIVLGLQYLYSIFKVSGQNRLNKFLLALAALGFIGCFFYLIFYTSFGGRIANQSSLVDGSTLARVDALKAFNYISDYDLMLGNPKNYIKITNALHAAGVENSYIVIIINYGICIGVCLMIALFFLIRKYLTRYTGMEKIILLISFILLGSFNNSLSGSTPWILFLFCASVFPFYGRVAIVQVSSHIEDKPRGQVPIVS